MEIQRSFLLSYTHSERGTQHSALGGFPSDVQAGTYLQGENPVDDQVALHWDSRLSKPDFHEADASWCDRDFRLIWMGRRTSKLYLLDGAGKRAPVKDSSHLIDPKWDPRRKKIYYLEPQFGLLMESDLDGTRRAPLCQAPASGFDLSRDGHSLVYCQALAGGLQASRFDLKAGTSQLLTRTSGCGALAQLKLSSDNTRLVGIDLGDGQIKTVDLSSGLIHQISADEQEKTAESEPDWTPYAPVRSSPTFSPDVSRVLYVRRNVEETETGVRSYGSLFAARSDGGAPHRVLGGRTLQEVILLQGVQVAPLF